MIPYEFDAERFSRWMAYVLRHNPGRYGLQADRHGYVDFQAFIAIAQKRYPGVSPEQLRELIATGDTDRFEVSGQRLRARYGHSIPVEPSTEAITPPERLYYGIDARRVPGVLSEGLKSTDRQLLHLSEKAEDAWAIIRRKTSTPALLLIDAQKAHAHGIGFYQEGKVYLASHMPAAFLSPIPAPSFSS